MSGGATAFAPSVDAAAYVPNAAAARVLAALEGWAAAGEPPVRVLRGPEGAGKSMLLAVLAERTGRRTVPVLVSAVRLDPDGLARRVLDALGAPWDGSPRVAVARAVEQLGARRVLLLVDDADALAPRTEMWLFDSVRRSGGGMLALLAVRDGRLATELANAFQGGTEVVTIEPALSREEIETWLRAELVRCGAGPEARARFDAPALARIHERSGGVPGRVRMEAAAFLAAAGEAAARPSAREAAPVPPAREAAPVPPARDAARVPRAATPPARDVAAPARASTSLTTEDVTGGREVPRGANGAPSPLAAPRSRPAARAAVAARRDSLLRWLVLPVALAAAYVAGFLTAQMLEALRAGPAAVPALATEADSAAAAPPVSAPPPLASGVASAALSPPAEADPAVAPAPPPPTALRGHDPFASPVLPAAGAQTSAAAPAAQAAAAVPPAVSAPPRAPASGPRAAGDPLAPPPASAAAPPGLAPEQPEQPERPRRRAEAPRSPTAVDVEAEPGASILVDGRPVGSGTVRDLRLAPGPHRVEVWLPDGRVVERVVEVRGTRYQIHVR